MPRPRAARSGSAAYVARPRRELTWVRPHSLGSPRGEGGRPRWTPAGPSPFSTSSSRGAGRQRRRHSRPGTLSLRRRELPGARTPRPPSLLLSPPAPPLRSRPRAGRGLRLPARARSPELAPGCRPGAPSGAGARRGVRGRLGGPAVSRLPAQHGARGQAGSRGGVRRKQHRRVVPCLPARRLPQRAKRGSAWLTATLRGVGLCFRMVIGVGVLWREVDCSFLSFVPPHPVSLRVKSQSNRVSHPGGADTLALVWPQKLPVDCRSNQPCRASRTEAELCWQFSQEWWLSLRVGQHCI